MAILCKCAPILMALFLIVGVGHSKTYYVSEQGMDSNSGLSEETPFKTIQKAADMVAAGDSVIIMEGIYAGFIINEKHGLQNSWIVFKADPEHKAVIDIYKNPSTNPRAVLISGCSYIEMNGFSMTDSNPLYDSDNPDDFRTGISHDAIKIAKYNDTLSSFIRIVNNEIFRIGFHGIYSSYVSHHCEILNNHIYNVGLSKRGYGMYIGGDDHIIRGNKIHNAYGLGIAVYSTGGPRPDRNLIEKNIVFNNGSLDYGAGDEDYDVGRRGDGIGVRGGGSNNIVRNNLVYGNMNWGILVNGKNSTIVNNTSCRNGYHGVYTYDNQNGIIRNNICLENGDEKGYPGDYHVGTGNTQDHNSWNLGITDVSFVAPDQGDFHLRRGSEAINRGSSADAPNEDIDGNHRPIDGVWDLGAYEFVGTTDNLARIIDVKILHVDSLTELSVVTPGIWYDLAVYFEGWANISYADVWISHNTSSEGNVTNRGGRFSSESNYITSFSTSTDQIWACETEGTNKSSNITGRLGLYIDDDNDEYVQNSSEQWARARIKLLGNALEGSWIINGYAKLTNGQKSELFQKRFFVKSLVDDTTPPSKPQNVNLLFQGQ